MISKLGDMLSEFVDDGTSITRKNEIKRLLNELGDREEKYKSWLSNLHSISAPSAYFNNLVEPLGTYALDFDTDATIATATKTFLTFDSAPRKSDAFALNTADLSKVMVIYPGTNIQMLGIVEWTQNATGYRMFGVDGYDVTDTLLGTKTLHIFPGHNLDDNIYPFIWTLDGFVIKEISYLKFWVKQSSGGNLDVKAADVILSKV